MLKKMLLFCLFNLYLIVGHIAAQCPDPIPPPIVFGEFAFCEGEATTLIAENGFSAYAWSTGSATQSIIINTPGTYSITVTSDEGCVGVTTVVVSQFPIITPTIEGPENLCPGEQGVLSVANNYASYYWANGEASSSITVATPGIWEVTVVNFNGCTGSASFEIENGLNLNCFQSQPDTDTMGGNGILQVIYGNGVPPYTLNWDGPQTGSLTINDAGPIFIPNLEAGDYQLTVVDTLGCQAICHFEIGEVTVGDNFSCSAAEELFLDNPGSCSSNFPITNAFTLNNYGATGSSGLPLFSGCQGDSQIDEVSSSVWYTFNNSGADLISISIQNGLSTPNIILYEGSDCDNLVPIACASAIPNSGQVTLESNLNQGFQYSIQIAGGNPQDLGVFDLYITSSQKCPDECKIFGSLIADPPPINGQYHFGQQVQFCYNIYTYELGQDNWLHALEVDFGSAWDLNTFAPIPSFPCNGAGYWGWYDFWVSCISGEAFGPGFAYDGPSSSCGGSIDGDPGNNWGDGGNGCSNSGFPFMFCWNIAVSDCVSNTSAQDLNIQINALDDGTSGGWNSPGPGCSLDADYLFFANKTNTPSILDLGPDVTLCQGESYTIDGSISNCQSCSYTWNTGENTPSITVIQPGTYSLTVTDPNGCGGEGSIDIILLPVSYTQIDEIICEGDALFLDGQVFTQPGSYEIVLTSSLGCDSIISLNLNVVPASIVDLNIQICEGDTVIIGNNSYNQSGQYTETLINYAGCDSIIILNLVVWDNPINMIDTTIQQGESITIGDSTYDQAGIYTDILFGASINGCDSIIITNLSIQPFDCFDPGTNNNILEANIIVHDEVTCFGDPEGVVEVIVTEADTLVNDLSDYEIIWSHGLSNESVAEGLPAGDYSVTVTNPMGCSASAGVTLDQPALIQTEINVSICEGDFYTFGGNNFDQPGVYTEVFIANNGCDSLIILTLEVLPNPVAMITASAGVVCAGQSSTLTGSGGTIFLWSTGENSSQITVAPLATTTYSLTVVDDNGCEGEASITIVVADAPSPPVISCTVTNSEIEFSWNPIMGVDSYEINSSIGQSQTISNTNFTITGLFPGESVTIEVVPIYSGPCTIESATLTCVTNDCPNLVLEMMPINPQRCEDDQPIQLEAVQTGGTGTGTFLWQGVGLISTDGLFDPIVAGPGVHFITLTYVEGVCEYSISSAITVHPLPIASFNLDNTICIDGFGTITFQGQAQQGAVYNWDFDGGTASPGIGPGPHEVIWSTSGLKTVSLIIEEAFCISEAFSRDVEVQATLAAPSISCIGFNDQLAFGWPPILGATGYDVNVLTGQAGFLNNNIFTVPNLEPAEEVTIEVIALNGGGICGNTTDTLSCIAEGDPFIMLTEPNPVFIVNEVSGQIQMQAKTPPSGIELKGPFPNPTQYKTWLELNLPVTQQVDMVLIDIAGRTHQVLTRQVLEKGIHPFEIETAALLPGLYFIKMKIEQQTTIKKLAVIR